MGKLESAIEELGGLRLPEGIEPQGVAGAGSRAITFRVLHRGEILAMKVYRKAAIDRFRKKHDRNIGVHEMSRNRQFRKVPELLPFTAKPISVMGHDGRCSLLFLQEFIDGMGLQQLAEQQKGLPSSVLEAGETIVRVAEMNGMYGLDLAVANVMVRKVNGVWQPVLYDFNQPPGSNPGANPLAALALKTGLRKESHQDYKNLQQWRKLSG